MLTYSAFVNMKLIPITTNQKDMQPYLKHEFIKSAFEATQKVYPLWGYHLPWVGYFAISKGEVVGVGGFKGPPKGNTVELGYGTVPGYEKKGIATEICHYLVQTALNCNPNLRITARTLPEISASTRILEKNRFKKLGVVEDPEDGPVWEWLYV